MPACCSLGSNAWQSHLCSAHKVFSERLKCQKPKKVQSPAEQSHVSTPNGQKQSSRRGHRECFFANQWIQEVSTYVPIARFFGCRDDSQMSCRAQESTGISVQALAAVLVRRSRSQEYPKERVRASRARFGFSPHVIRSPLVRKMSLVASIKAGFRSKSTPWNAKSGEFSNAS